MAFRCGRPGAVTFIEFIGPGVSRAELNGRELPAAAFDGGRLLLDQLAAENVLTVSATASYMRDGTGLHRFCDPIDGRIYLHSQFASNDAQRAFACFDQPDLKATYTFHVKAPADWVVVSNAPGTRTGGGIWSFPTTSLISTYLAAIVAGNYHMIHQDHRGIPLGLYCRQSLARYLDPGELFEITRQGLDYFEERFSYPYMFGKYDQLFVPEFSAGAMENAGCVTFTEQYVFRSRVTQAARMRRSETILHEMAHMWFGDLVTMRWWDDLWLNESFATYMGNLANVAATRFANTWTSFAMGYKARAMSHDQLPTTHPIVADIPDVDAVHLNFDPITYEKGCSALKQLVAWVGEDAFFAGVRTYCKRHAYGNTELVDFLATLEESSGRDLKGWSLVWLQQAGVNTLSGVMELEGAHIKTATILQEAPALHPTLRPHRLRVGLFDVEGNSLKRRDSLELDIDGRETAVPQLAGERAPDVLLVNDYDLTYAKLKLDHRSLSTLKTHLRGLDDPLARALAWGALWDMLRDAELRARDFIEIVLSNIDVETDAAVVASLLGRVVNAIDSASAPQHRAKVRELLASAALSRVHAMPAAGDLQLLWTQAFIGAARTPADVAWVRGLLDGSTTVDGLEVDFAIRWSVVNAMATIGIAGEDLIAAEVARDPTDQGLRAAAAARAARPLPQAKADAWAALTVDSTLSLAMRRALASGFHRVDQADMLGAYVQPYFNSLLAIWESYGIDEALELVEYLYPATVVTRAVSDLTDGWLAHDLPAPIHRSLLERQDELNRSLRARAFDSA